MNILDDKHTLPGNVHPTGLVVVAALFLGGYWILSHRTLPIGTESTHGEDIGYGGGVKPFGWNGDAFQEDDELHEGHFRRVMIGREPAYHQPEVIAGGQKTPWYRFIDKYTYNQRNKPFLSRRSYP